MSAVLVNPGRLLILEGSFELAMSLVDVDAQQRPDLERTQRGLDPALLADRQTGERVTLADLLRSFLADPTETVTGPIRITIEAA